MSLSRHIAVLVINPNVEEPCLPDVISFLLTCKLSVSMRCDRRSTEQRQAKAKLCW